MSAQIDYQILLQEIVRTAKLAADAAKQDRDDKLLFAYYDILDVVKTQAEVMGIPLSEIGLENVDLDEYVKATVEISRHQAA